MLMWLARRVERTRAMRLCCVLFLGLTTVSVLAQNTPDPTPAAYTVSGRVVRVSDGDTFVLLAGKHQQRIRMASIDAPETGQSSRNRPGQPYAQASRAALAALIAGKTLTLPCFEPDNYGRHVCDVPLEDGTSANQQMVLQGMAWANRQNKDRYLRDPRLIDLEQQARTEKRGLWRDAKPIEPWLWRDQCWRKQQCG